MMYVIGHQSHTYGGMPPNLHFVNVYVNGDPKPFVSIDPPVAAAPVGGVVMPMNKFAIFASWLAAIGLVGCIGTAAAVGKPWKKPEN